MVMDFLDRLARFSSSESDTEGVTRLPFTPEQAAAAEFLYETMRQLGMEAHVDSYGTVAGILPGRSQECILIASHYDTVPCGGKFDGAAGIAVGLEAVRYLRDHGLTPRYTVAVAALNDEEGVRFNYGFLSSKVICGELDRTMMTSTVDRESGRTLQEVLAAERFRTIPEISFRTILRPVTRYLEIHVEQGPVLDRKGFDCGLVERIVGLRHVFYELQGESNHAGTTPMNERRDPLPALGGILAGIPAVAADYPQAVATVGCVQVRPNVMNVIADRVEFGLDARSGNEAELDALTAEIGRLMERVMAQHPGLTLRASEGTCAQPVPMDGAWKRELERSVRKTGASYLSMQSGAGHDAQIFAKHVKTAMLFLPSRGGYSHSAREYTESEHLERAVTILVNLLMGE